MDRRFWPDNPDPGFSPERNQRIINKTIAKYEAKRAQARKDFERNQLGERVDAVATYLTSLRGATAGKSVEAYFGRRELARLRGEEIISTLKSMYKPHIKLTKKGRIKGINVSKTGKEHEKKT